MTRGRRLLSICIVLCCVGPAPALAARPSVKTPPGNSAGNQYVETLPGAGSNHAVTPGSGRGLPAQIRSALASRGRAGAVVLGLGAQAPVSDLATGRHRGHSPSRNRPTLGGLGVKARSPVLAVSGVLTGSGAAGLGWGLPAALILITLLAVGLAWRSASGTGARP